ncbi:MAG: inverse autotransporter beta domain-containing protein, partial [Hyphomicrobiales bacterium]|nr:inverse autotransporter beta domain-containing protein [Hyphomicrobiales bacterium]
MNAKPATSALRARILGGRAPFESALCKHALWWACFALLFPFVLLSSSSEADDIAPWRSAVELERVWGGVLGCADPGNDEEAMRKALAGGSVPYGGVRYDYLDCGTRALRNAASRMLVDTIENSLRYGGSNLFDREFRLDSNLTWVLGESVRGELGTIIPLGGMERRDGTGKSFFLQPGMAFWSGRGEELRSDFNTGVVYRGHVRPDLVVGSSFFFDYNFQREHVRLSIGLDAQSDIFYGGVNYYFTLGKEWRRGRGGYQERVLEGLDLHWSLKWDRWQLDGSFGAWVFDGDQDGKGSGWRPSVDASVGYKIHPGVFLELGYERHDARSLGADWNLGVAFRYSLPDLEGIGGNGVGGMRAPDLWRTVDRERRIIYEERLAPKRMVATMTATPERVAEGHDVTVRVDLKETIKKDVFFSVAALSNSTADAEDYTPLPSRMTIPAGAMWAEETFRIREDEYIEPEEMLDLELKILPESFFFVVRGDPHREQVVIEAGDNGGNEDNAGTSNSSIVGFARESTSVTEGMKVHVPLALGAPPPAGGFVLATSSDNDEDVTVEAQMRIVPDKQYGQYVYVTVVNDVIPEGAEMVRIFLDEPPGGLPEDWQLARREHMLMILPDDFNISFERDSSEVGEGAGIVNLILVLNEPAPAGLALNVSSSLDGDAVPVHPTLTVPEGVRRVELPVRIIDDNIGEGDEIATITISAAGSLPEGWGIGSPDAHALRIKDNDLGLGFTRPSSEVRESDLETDIEITLSETGAPSGGINLTVTATGNEGNDISFTSPVAISPGEKEKILKVTITQDNLPEGAERIVLTLSGQLPESWEYGQQTHELTILPNENEVAFEKPSTAVHEGDGTVDVALVLNRPAPEGLVLAFDSSSPGDAVPSGPTLRIPAGETKATLTVRIVNDNIGEAGETVTISIAGNPPTALPEGWSIGSQDTHDLIVTDDDLFVGFESASSQVHESDLTTNLGIVLSEVGAPTGGMSLSVSATGNDDNDVSFSTLLPISTGDKRGELMVALAQDDLAEGDEVIVLALSGSLPSPWEFGQQTHRLTILSHGEREPKVVLPGSETAMFAQAGKTVNESEGTATFKVALSADAPAGGVPLQVAIDSGNEEGDVTFTTEIFTIAEGNREHTISVGINNDTLVEPDETVTFVLSKRSGFPEEWGGLGSQTTFELTITDDDSADVGFTSPSSTLTESDTTAMLAVGLNGSVLQNVEVTLTESGDGNNDLAFSPALLTFAPGETGKDVTLTVNSANNDTRVEEDVEITYTLGGLLPDGVSFSAREHVVTFMDDDSANVGFTSPSSTLTEGDTTATLMVRLNGSVSQNVEVTISESGDGNNDLGFTPTSLTFTPGQTSKDVTLTVNSANNDTRVEENVEITYTLTGMLPDGVNFATDRHVVTFTDDDSASVGFTSPSSTLTESDTTAKLTVRLDGSVSGNVEVMISESGDGNNDLEFAPTSLTFAPGETSKDVTLTVNASNNDSRVEENVEITYTLGGPLPDGVTFSAREHVVTFTDDDSATVGFTSPSSTLTEGDTTAKLTVSLVGSVSQNVEVMISESGDGNNDLEFTPTSL